MYHFTADHPPEPVRLSFRALIPGHIRQYLKDFQLEAIRFMHNFLARGEFCIYNDESGLGKQAAVVVLLDAVCSSRKCLIVVQNDDRYVTGWEFHLKVLTDSNIMVIKDEKDSTDSPHNIYIAKWSTLRTIDDLAKFKFDFIILDNRGQMLGNSFCTSMLLKQYERKVNILLSSVDITSDLKLLHNVLRLGGRLDPQYSNFKVFEEKFKLPDAKELAYKRVDLEEYFCKRERLADYCKTFRLRRYCHQFESQLPLVKQDRYKINLELWREKQNATNSESSSIEYVNQKNLQNQPIKDTQELFEEYCRKRKKQHLQFQQEEEQRLQQREREMLENFEAEKQTIYSIDDEDEVVAITETPSLATDRQSITRENSDEQVLMSPLLVESDSDADDNPEMCNPSDNIEIVDLASEENEEEKLQDKQNNRKETISNDREQFKENKKRRVRKRTELEKLEENIVDTLKLKEVHKRLSRHKKSAKEDLSKNKRLKDRLKEKRKNKNFLNQNTPNTLKCTRNADLSIKNEYNTPQNTATAKINLEKSKEIKNDPSKSIERTLVEYCSTAKNEKKINKNIDRNTLSTAKSNTKKNENNTSEENMNITESGNTTPLTSRKTRHAAVVEKIPNVKQENTKNNQVQIKQEQLEETPKGKNNIKNERSTKANSEKLLLKREIEITPAGINLKLTRSMQRLTRSAGGGSKYLKKNLSLQIDKISKCKKKLSLKETQKSTNGSKESQDLKDVDNKQIARDKKLSKEKSKIITKNTQTSIISQRSSQDYESMQCAQRLSDAGIFDQCIEKTAEFLVPSAPNAISRNSLLPSSLTSSSGFLAESEVIFIPPSNAIIATNKKLDQAILLSSSENENSTSQSSSNMVSTTSRRTRALKPKRHQQQLASEASKVSSFSDLLAQQNTRLSTKSPDLFSNCSDLMQLPCTQKNVDNEEPNTPFEGFKIFGSEVKQMQQHYALNKNSNHPETHVKKSYREQRSCLDILEKMFEPSNKKSKVAQNDKSPTTSKKSNRNESKANKQKIHIQILPSHPVEAIIEARQRHQQEIQKKSSTTSTSAGLLQDDDFFEITNNGTFGSVMRLHSNGDISPVQNVQKANSKQHNKITNYLIGNTIQNGSQEELATNSGNSMGYFNAEAGTPSKRYPQFSTAQNNNMKKSPKSKCNTTQATKLTKWFTKPSELNGAVITAKSKTSNIKKTPTKKMHGSADVELTQKTAPSSPSAAVKRVLKRRRLDLSFSK